jgi:peptidyl-prolyl cis-trans isomerase SurA
MYGAERKPLSILLFDRTDVLKQIGSIAAIVAALACGPVMRGDIIDRIAVSVGNQVITQSELDREMRVTAFLDRVKPDFSPAARRATAERMVEQKLIRRELETSRYPPPAASEVQPILDKFKKENFADDAAFQSALASYGITEKDVIDELLWQRTLLQFIDVRFRPGVQVSEPQIKDYFDRVVEPAARAAHPGEAVSLEDYRDEIDKKLAGERVDRETDIWLKQARQRTEVVYHEEVFQ